MQVHERPQVQQIRGVDRKTRLPFTARFQALREMKEQLIALAMSDLDS